MEGRVRNENISQQFPRDKAVDGNARIDVVIEADFAFKDDERPCMGLGEGFADGDDFIDKPFQLFHADDLTGTEKAPAPDLFQGPAQFRLEDDRQGNEDDRHPLLQHPVDDVQVQDLTDHRDHAQDQEPLDQGHSPRIANQDEQFIEDKGNEQDIQYIEQPKAADETLKG